MDSILSFTNVRGPTADVCTLTLILDEPENNYTLLKLENHFIYNCNYD